MKKSILDKKKKIREKISNIRSSFDAETLINFSLNAQLNLLEFLKKKNFKMRNFSKTMGPKKKDSNFFGRFF